MVTVAGQWWMDNREVPIAQVASHIAALGWMGLRHLPTVPNVIEPNVIEPCEGEPREGE